MCIYTSTSECIAMIHIENVRSINNDCHPTISPKPTHTCLYEKYIGQAHMHTNEAL